MTDLIKEVLRSNELRMNEDYSYTMNNGEVQINQPSLEIALDVGQSMTPGLSLSGVGSAIAKGLMPRLRVSKELPRVFLSG